MPCDLATILTLYGSSPPQSPTPIIPWDAIPNHDLWPDTPGTPFIPSNPCSTHAHTPNTSSRLDDPWTSGPLIEDHPRAYRKVWGYDWKDREIPMWITLDGFWYDTEPFDREEEYQASKKQFQVALEELIRKVQAQAQAPSYSHSPTSP
jgi:hypothetical protein